MLALFLVSLMNFFSVYSRFILLGIVRNSVSSLDFGGEMKNIHSLFEPEVSSYYYCPRYKDGEMESGRGFACNLLLSHSKRQRKDLNQGLSGARVSL